MSISFTIQNSNELKDAANKLIHSFSLIRVFLFEAEMGAGKTTFIKEIAKQLGVDSPMSSPTYSIVNEYTGTQGTIYHFDLYRIRSIEECFDFGMEEYLSSGNYCFIEWPELANMLYPEKYVMVKIEVRDGTRFISASLNK